jgi:hypothetical protein
MALSDCTECWSTPCECGHEFKGASREYKEKITKSVNGFTIQDVFLWLSKNDYLTDDWDLLYAEFMRKNEFF